MKQNKSKDKNLNTVKTKQTEKRKVIKVTKKTMSVQCCTSFQVRAQNWGASKPALGLVRVQG